MRLRHIHLSGVFLGLTCLLLLLNLAEAPRPAPHNLSALSCLRILIGLPIVLFVPGIFFAPLIFGKSIRSRLNPQALDLIWTLVASFGLNVFLHFVQIRLLAARGVTTLDLTLLTLGFAGLGFGVVFLRCREVEYQSPTSNMVRGALWGLGTILLLVLLNGPKLARDSSWYFYNSQLNQNFEGAIEPELLKVTWDDGTKFTNGEAFKRRGRIMAFQVENRAPIPQRVPVVALVHGPVGTEAWIEVPGAPDRPSPHERIATSEVMEDGQHQIERYYDWGTAAITALTCRDDPTKPPYDPNELCEAILLQPGEIESFELHIRPFEYDETSRPEDTFIAGWVGLSRMELEDSLGSLGHRHMHPFQLLNVTENIRWAEELLLGEFILPGRPARLSAEPQGVALAQPPAWSYLYSPARRLLTEHTASASALTISFLILFVVVGLKATEDELGATPLPLIGAALGLAGAQSGDLMISDGSLNFPDNLYALALLVSLAALVSRRTRVFVVWALLATLLRYPGGVVIGIMGASMFLVAPKSRRGTLNALAQFMLPLALFCCGMLVMGIRSGLLAEWFYSLYWETIPEHFQNNANAAPMLLRPIIFNLKWVVVGGAVLLLALPFRGVLSRVCTLTALAYMPFLAFIDHHSNHYFLPLILFSALAACSSVSLVVPQKRPRWTFLLALFSLVLFLGSHHGKAAVERFGDRISIPHETLPLGPEDEEPTPPEDAPEEEALPPKETEQDSTAPTSEE